MNNRNRHSEAIIKKAQEIGFHAIATVGLNKIDDQFESFYYEWINRGYHGEMQYLEKNASQRFNADAILENAKTALIILASYNHGQPQFPNKLKIARYALGLDYHFIIKNKLNELLTFIQTLVPQAKGRALTDSAPVAERYLASKAGLGFIGKNGMLINKQLGSFFFIGELYIDIDLDIPATTLNKPIQQNKETLSNPFPRFDACETCDKCIKACPNQAIIEPGIVNSNQCIAYKTIEYKHEFDNNNRLAGYIFGCDICQNVCPFNSNIIDGWSEFNYRKEIAELLHEDWLSMSQKTFKQHFFATPMYRTGLKQMKRNIRKVDSERDSKQTGNN